MPGWFSGAKYSFGHACLVCVSKVLIWSCPAGLQEQSTHLVMSGWFAGDGAFAGGGGGGEPHADLHPRCGAAGEVGDLAAVGHADPGHRHERLQHPAQHPCCFRQVLFIPLFITPYPHNTFFPSPHTTPSLLPHTTPSLLHHTQHLHSFPTQHLHSFPSQRLHSCVSCPSLPDTSLSAVPHFPTQFCQLSLTSPHNCVSCPSLLHTTVSAVPHFPTHHCQLSLTSPHNCVSCPSLLYTTVSAVPHFPTQLCQLSLTPPHISISCALARV